MLNFAALLLDPLYLTLGTLAKFTTDDGRRLRGGSRSDGSYFADYAGFSLVVNDNATTLTKANGPG